MKQSEVGKLLTLIATAYPDKFKSDDAKINLWHSLLKDIDYPLALLALQSHLSTSAFIPTIADIRKAAANAQDTDSEIDSGQAWGEVMSAIKNFGIYRPEEAFQSMNPKAARVAKQIGWQEICLCEEIGVVRGQFLKMYSAFEIRDKGERLLPAFLKAEINKVKELKAAENKKINPFSLEEVRAKTLSDIKLLESKELNVADLFINEINKIKSME